MEVNLTPEERSEYTRPRTGHRSDSARREGEGEGERKKKRRSLFYFVRVDGEREREREERETEDLPHKPVHGIAEILG